MKVGNIFINILIDVCMRLLLVNLLSFTPNEPMIKDDRSEILSIIPFCKYFGFLFHLNFQRHNLK